jgi:putative ABC transport system permease protein
MFSLYRTLSWRYFQERRFRALLVVASIALGVGTLVATRALNESMWSATRVATTPLAAVANLIVSNGDTGVPRELVARVAQVPGVRRAEPIVVGRVRLPDLGDQPGDHRHAQVLGIVWRSDSVENNPWHVTIDWTIPPDSIPGLKGSDPQDLLARLKFYKIPVQPVLVGKELQAQLQQVPAEPWLDKLLKAVATKEMANKLKTLVVRIQPVGQEPRPFIKAGIVTADGMAGTLVNHALIMNAADAAEFLGQPNLFTRIDLFLDEGTDHEEVRRRVSAVLKGQATVRTPGENDQRVQETMKGLQLGFSLSGAGALVIGLFLVYMILSVTVADRRHEIGILRSLGATRGQIWALFVGEAGLMGLLGAALGIPTGLFLADYLGREPIQRLLSELLVPLDATKLEVTPDTVAIAAGAGIVTTLLAALIPAIRAAQEEPASAVRRVPPLPGLAHWVFLEAISGALFLTGTVCMVWRKELPERWGTYGGFVLVLLGTLLTTPLLASLAARLLQPLARLVLGIEGRLAADNLVRAPARTGLVITVLAAGVALFLQTAGVIRSNRDPIMEWVSQTVDADLIVSSGSTVTGSGQNLIMSEEFADTVQNALPQVDAMLAVRFRQVEYGEARVFLVALDAVGFHAANRHPEEVTGRDLFPSLRQAGPAQALISENFRAIHGVQEGDSISLRGPRGSFDLHVAGVIVDYNFPRGTVLIDRDLYRRLFDDHFVDEFYLYLKPGTDPLAVRQEMLRRWENKHALKVSTRDELLERFEGMIQRFAGVAYAQEVVVAQVAALGVVFALLISVMQRRSELGVLRAIGATQGQVLGSVLAEAVLMGVIGTTLGLVIGVPVEWYCVHVIMFEEAGFLFPVRIPWQEAGMIAAGAMFVATAAGLGPAWITSRLRIPEAIAYE